MKLNMFLSLLFIPLLIFSQITDYPDVVVSKIGIWQSCTITYINRSIVEYNYNNKTKSVALTDVGRIRLDSLGIVFKNESGFTRDISLLQKFIDKRNKLNDISNNYNRITSVFLQVWGPEIIGFHFNTFIANRFSVNLGIGIITDAHIGFNMYFSNRNKSISSIYLGIQLISYNHFNPFGSSSGRQFGIYLPIGIEIIARNGFTIQFDVGPNVVEEDWEQRNTEPFLVSFKIGYTFNK